ncbi:hypothetical protein Bca4012_024727 [Brassica carinata]
MGEDKTIEFESGRQTLVFWNMDDYPIPVGTSDDLGAVSSNMFEALQQMGFRGYMSMEVYSEQPKSYEKEEWWMPQICYAPKCKSYSAIFHELPDIALWIIDMTSRTGPGPLNVALIAKPNGELLRVLRCLKSRNHDVLVIDPPPPCCPPLFSVASLLENARLLDGPKPRFKAMLPDYLYVDDIDEENLDIKEDVSKTVDFSERIPTVKGAWGIKCASGGQSSYLGQQNRGSKLVTAESKSTRKHYAGKDGWVCARKGRKGRISQSSKSVDKKEIAVNVYIDLESTSIDIPGALTLDDSINDIIKSLDTEDSKYKAGYVTIYVLDSLDENIVLSLYRNDVLVKNHGRRKALCKPCREYQKTTYGRTTKPKLMEFYMITDIAWYASSEIERGFDKEQLKPIMIITHDDHSVNRLADELEREGGFTVIRTLPNGMRNESMYKQLTQDEISLRLSRRLDRI